MSDYQDRLGSLRLQGQRAADALNDLDPGVWSDSDWRQQFEDILAYARVVFEVSDAALLSVGMFEDLNARLQEWIDNPAHFAGVRDPWRDQMLDSLSRLPVSRGHDIEQRVKGAAATFQRSLQQRTTTVQRHAEAVQSEVQTLAAQLAERRAEIESLVEQARTQQDQAAEERLSQLNARSGEIQATVELHAQSIDALLTEQGEAFRKVQDERATEYREQQQAYEERIGVVERDARARTESLVAEIQAMKTRSAELVGAIGITGTAERYGEEFSEQKGAADRWRLATLAVGILAVIASGLAAFDHDTTTAGAKIAIALLIGGVAAYTARQSSRHRRREEHARQLQLDLTAFPVFIENLPAEDQYDETILMGRRSFLGANAGADEDEDEPGPSAIRQAIPRRRRKAEAKPDNDD